MENNILKEKSTQQQSVLHSFSRALKREAFNLSQHPDLIWQQLFNRLQWAGDDARNAIESEYQHRRKSNSKAWFCSLSHPQENEAFQFSLSGHKDQVNHAIFSSNGKLISTSSDDGTVRIWKADSGKELIKLDVQPYKVISAVFSKDSNRILLITNGFREHDTKKNYYSRAMVWDVNTSQMCFVIGSQNRWVKQAVFSPDCRLIATIEDKYIKEQIYYLNDDQKKDLLSQSEVRIWDAETGEQLHIIKGNVGEVSAISFNKDGSIIATSCMGDVKEGQEPTGKWIMTGVNQQSPEYRKYRIVKDSATHLWDTNTGKEILTLSDHKGGVFNVVFSPDGSKLLTIGIDPSAILWDTKTGQKIKFFNEIYGSTLFSPDSKKIITNEGNQISLWDLDAGEKLHTIQGHEEWAAESAHTISGRRIEIKDVLFNSSGDKIVTCGSDNTAIVWDITSGKELIKLSGHDQPVLTAGFSPDGNHVVTASADGTAKVWLITDEVQSDEVFGHIGSITSVVFSPNGQTLATAGYDRTICIWDPNTGELISKFGYDEEEVNYYDRLVFSPDCTRIATMQTGRFFPKVWNVQEGTLEFKSEHKYGVLDLDYSPKGTCFVTGSNDFNGYIRDTKYGWETYKLKGHTGWMTTVAFDPSGDFIVTGSTDHSIRIWKTSNGKLEKILNEHLDSVNMIVFNNSGSRFASASDDKTIIIWDFQTKLPLFKFTNQITAIKHIAFSKDGELIAAVDESGQVLFSEIPRDKKQKSIFSKNKSEEIKIIQTFNGNLFREVVGAGQRDTNELDSPGLYSFNPKGDHLFAICNDGLIKVWQIETKTEVAAFPLLSLTNFDISQSKPLMAVGDEGARLHLLELVGIP
ncbi:MAG: WD40 repeat domain-containing protein [Anaerolineaceae bacterium]|nr:WD40 repeat domain-containing protein [Anaerolineaceae bacterium]